MKQEEKILIDRYIDNVLTGSELNTFLQRLETDRAFRETVSFHNLLIEGMREEENRRLTAALVQRINYSKSLIPLGLKLILVFLAITAGGIVLWNMTGQDTANRRDYFSLRFLNNTPKKDQQEKKVEEKPMKKEPVRTQEKGSTNIEPGQESTETKAAEDIVVKKDQLLISVLLKPIAISDSSIDNSAQENDASKMDVDASIAEDKSENYNVEFWLSPVNYRGYKLVDDKLILFGIEEPDAVQLFTDTKKLWMKYGEEFYSLERSDNFEAFISSTEIPSVLR